MIQIGFIGLGHMGTPMVQNLLKKKHRVMVYDLREEAMEPLVKLGAMPAKHVSQLAETSDIIFTMLQTSEQVTDVLTNKLIPHAKPNTLFIDTSSIDIDVTRELASKVEEANLQIVDAPVSGGVAGAEAASLTIMVGGEASAFKRAEPLLRLLGKNVIHAGPHGNGQAAKICNNLILGISMIGVSEAFALAEKCGLDAKTFFDISSKASGQCWSMTSYCPAPGVMDNVPSSNDYKPGFAASMMLKDLKLAKNAAVHVNATIPMGEKATQIYDVFTQEGHENMDFSGIFTLFQNGDNK